MLDEVLANLPLIVGTVFTLVFLEGLLSADNALVLAVMVRHLPQEQRKKALKYGIFGAFFFRAIAVMLSSVLLDYWIFKVVGGLYLLYLALSHFLSGGDDPHQPKSSRFGSGFWGTVVAVELADIAFSIDSIVAAVAMAPPTLSRFLQLAIVFTGGVLGIITMRFVAGYFIILLDRFKGLAAGAYYLVAWIGLKLVIGGFHTGRFITHEMPEWFFWGGMLTIVVVSMIYKPRNKDGPKTGQEELAETVEVGKSDEGATPP